MSPFDSTIEIIALFLLGACLGMSIQAARIQHAYHSIKRLRLQLWKARHVNLQGVVDFMTEMRNASKDYQDKEDSEEYDVEEGASTLGLSAGSARTKIRYKQVHDMRGIGDNQSRW